MGKDQFENLSLLSGPASDELDGLQDSSLA